MKSYLCGDEWNSIVAEKDSDSSSVSISVSAVQQQQEFTSSGSVWGSKTGTRMSDQDEDDDDFELCSNYSGDEEDDDEDDDVGDSVKSSEATVTQPMNIVLLVCGGEGTDTNRVRSEKPNSTLKLFQQEDAAIIIQSAFRGYLVRFIHFYEFGHFGTHDQISGKIGEDLFSFGFSYDQIGTNI